METTIVKVIRLKALNLYRDFYKEYIKTKYGPKGDFCLIYSHDRRGLSYMTSSNQGVYSISKDACHYIRRICGENKLMIYGLPKPDESALQLVLVPTLSMLKVLGWKKFKQFLQDWEGDSKVGEVVVIKYSVWQ